MPLLPFRLGKIGKANVGWAVVTFVGLYGFIVAKNQVDKQRYDIMKAKERMQNSNSGDYIPSDRKFT
jgi:hypothetical protein